MTVHAAARGRIATKLPITTVAFASGVLVATFLAGFAAAADRLGLTPPQLGLMIVALIAGERVAATQTYLSRAGTFGSCLIGGLGSCLVQFASTPGALAAGTFVIGTAATLVYARLRHQTRRDPHGTASRSVRWASALGLLTGTIVIAISALPGGHATAGFWANAAPAVALPGVLAALALVIVSPTLPELRLAARPWPATAALLAVLLFIPPAHRCRGGRHRRSRSMPQEH